MEHRSVEIAWLPRSHQGWQTYTSARKEAARLWRDLVLRHARIRRMAWKWPRKSHWQGWAKGRYPHLSAQSVQQIIADFLEAVDAIRQLRKHVHAEARYPLRTPRYKSVIYTNQDARIRDGYLILPKGSSGTLKVKLPRPLPGRLKEVRLDYGKLELVCEMPAEALPSGLTIGCDLGVNTLIAETFGKRAILISGSFAKATVQWRNKRLASMQTRRRKLTKGSRMWQCTQRRKYQLLDKSRRRIRDIIHKATRKVADFFPQELAFVGEPFNNAARKQGRVQAQQVSSACNRKIIWLLGYKLGSVNVVNEAWSSRTCPGCGRRSKQKRIYRCRGCKLVAPRDVVGATNILSIGTRGGLTSGCAVPNSIHFVYPA